MENKRGMVFLLLSIRNGSKAFEARLELHFFDLGKGFKTFQARLEMYLPFSSHDVVASQLFESHQYKVVREGLFAAFDRPYDGLRGCDCFPAGWPSQPPAPSEVSGLVH